MKNLRVVALVVGLSGCVSSNKRAPSSHGDLPRAEAPSVPRVGAVIAIDQQSKKTCLLNQDKNNYYGPALQSAVILPHAKSRQSYPQIPECSKKVNEQYQSLASISYQDGPQVAFLAAAIPYYLACSVVHYGTHRLNDGSIDRTKISSERAGVQEAASMVGVTATLSICLPVTAINAALAYVFTDEKIM